jgi:hypothetical protein
MDMQFYSGDLVSQNRHPANFMNDLCKKLAQLMLVAGSLIGRLVV